MDIKFTNRLQKKDWEMIIGEFQDNVTDSVIECAIKRQPPEIFAIRGKEMIEKLKSRRDGLLHNGMKYYSFLQRIARAHTDADYLATGTNRMSSPSL